VALFLFLKPLLQRLHDLFPGPERLDLLHFLFGEELLGHRLQPILGNGGAVIALEGHLQALEHLGKDLVEPVEQAFVLHQCRAGEIIEFLRALFDDPRMERFEQDEMFLERHRYAGAAQFVHERKEHRGSLLLYVSVSLERCLQSARLASAKRHGARFTRP